MGENFKWPTTQKIENEKKGERKAQYMRTYPKIKFFRKKT